MRRGFVPCRPNPPSRDSAVTAQHHQTLVSESQNAGGDLQPLSGMPAGSRGGDGGALISFSQPGVGQPASLADPSSGFQPLDPLGLIPNQPLDLGTLPTTSFQNVDLFAQVAADVGMPLDAFTQAQTIGAQQNSAIGNIQSVIQTDPNVEYVLNRQGTFVHVDLSQQTSTAQYTIGTATCTSVGMMPA